MAKVLDPEVPKLIQAIYGIPAPAAPREDIAAAFLTGIKGLNQPPKVTPAELLRLNTGIAPAANPNRLGALVGDNAGFPNGRRLADDVVDIEIQALEGALRTGKIVQIGDRINVQIARTNPHLLQIELEPLAGKVKKPKPQSEKPSGSPRIPPKEARDFWTPEDFE